jgi:hypothetical protein
MQPFHPKQPPIATPTDPAEQAVRLLYESDKCVVHPAWDNLESDLRASPPLRAIRDGLPKSPGGRCVGECH